MIEETPIATDWLAHMKAIGPLGGKARAAKLSPARLRKIGQLGAKKRWEGVRLRARQKELAERERDHKLAMAFGSG